MSEDFRVLVDVHNNIATADLISVQLKDIKDPQIPMFFSIQKLEELGYEFFVSSGTALGLFRDGDFIPTDTDVDIDIITNRQECSDIQQELEEMYRGEMKLARSQYLQMNEVKLPMQLAFLHKNGTVIDHYIYYTDLFISDGEEALVGVSYQCNVNEWGYMQYAQFDIMWTHHEKYGFLPVPTPLEDYFEVRYGEDWQTPKDSKGIFHNEEE